MYNDTLKAAKGLLGKYLVHDTADGEIVGKIVETEAYLEDDPASHSSTGKTKRNAQMFEKAGTAYIYLIYGMYDCFNVVTGRKGRGEAVLIRALEPVKGVELMKRNRKVGDVKDLCSGPGKLTIAMGISNKMNGLELKGKLRIASSKEKPEVVQTTRIGITKGTELPYRFYIKGNKFVSRG